MRGLGKRVKLARMNTARNQVVPCAFRSAFGKDRRFYFQKSVLIIIVTGYLGYPVAEHEIPLQMGTPKVQITVLQP